MKKVDIRTRRRIKGLLSSIIILFIIIIYTGYNSFKYNYITNVNYQNDMKIIYHLYDDNNKEINNNKNLSKIKILFDYQYSADKTMDVEYKYKVIGILKITGNDNNSSLRRQFNLLDEVVINKELIDNYLITEELELDYHAYYDLAKDFVDSYGEKSTSEFEIYFTVTNNNQDYNAKLTIPLVSNDFKIEKYLDEKNDSFKINKTIEINNYLLLIITVIGLLIEIVLIIYTIKYSIKNSLSSTKYERFINNLLKKYDDDIVNGKVKLDFNDFTIINVNSFKELLDVKNTVREPILYNSLTTKLETHFFIKNNHDLYLYKVSEDDFKDK